MNDDLNNSSNLLPTIKSHSCDIPMKFPKQYLQTIRKCKTFDLGEFQKVYSQNKKDVIENTQTIIKPKNEYIEHYISSLFILCFFMFLIYFLKNMSEIQLCTTN